MKPLKKYEDWLAESDQPSSGGSTHIQQFDEFNEGIMDALSALKNKLASFGKKIAQKSKSAKDSAEKAAKLKDKAAKATDPLVSKIASSKADDEKQKMDIKAAEGKLEIMKQKLAASELKTLDLKAKKTKPK